MINVVIIDNGIDKDIFNYNIKNKIVINSEMNYQDSKNEKIKFPHGTIVALIVKKYLEMSNINSICILDNEGMGTLNNLRPALEWCLWNNIDIVNLSLGTTHFQDRKKLLKIINFYANRGLCIVAATSNSGFVTYPASFSNVIGVVSVQYSNYGGDVHLGIDVKAESKHEILMGNELEVSQASNSYAAPYVSAIVGQIMEKTGYKEISEIKDVLFKRRKEICDSNVVCPLPDWISIAYFVNYNKVSRMPYYFETHTSEKDIEFELVDSIIVKTLEDLKQYKNKDKHIVYLGDEQVNNPNEKKFFWSKQNRIRQILCSRKKNGSFDIPIIICDICIQIDEIEILSILRDAFSEDGYNIYTASCLIDSVLYDLEYIPKEMLSEANINKLKDFLYWQIYYKKNEGILLAVSNYQTEKKDIYLKADICLTFECIENKKKVTIFCEGINIYSEIYENIGKEAIRNSYIKIRDLLTEEE